VDYAAFRRLITRQIDMGVSALVIAGTTGEISTLTADEKHKLITTAIDENKNRVPLIFGIGGNNPYEIIALGKFIKKLKTDATSKVGNTSNNKFIKKLKTGGSSKTGIPQKNDTPSKIGLPPKIGVMITSPYYNKGTQDGIYQFFETITNAVKLPTIVYNIPARTGVNIEPDTLYRISTLRYVAGIKEASGNISQIGEVVMKCPNTAVYSGDDTLALPSYAVGCRGIISVASNIFVAPVKSIYEEYKKGKNKSALTIFNAQLPFYKSLFVRVNPIPIKHYMAKEKLIKNELRLPLTPME
jgi:4-hydroxy-tetrahydrodipicolinate synthase